MASGDLPDAIQWHEGMLLTPQHFQQAAARQEALLRYHSELMAPFHWGVRHFAFDENLLADGAFRLEELEAVLPDGLAISYHYRRDDELIVDLTPHKQKDELTIFAAVPAGARGIPSTRGELARFESIEGELVPDENSGGREVRIPRLKPRVHLHLADELPAKYVGFPLARLVYADESFSLTDFVPATLQVRQRSPLERLCRDVTVHLREKANYLAEQTKAPSSALRAPQLVGQKHQIHCLVAALPHLEAVLASRTAHPYPLFLALCQIVGHVAGVGKGLVPPVLEAYAHEDPYPCFRQARDFIVKALEEGIVEDYTAYTFERRNGSFLLEFDPRWAARSLVLGVRDREGMSAESTERWLDRCLIGSRQEIPTLERRRITGAQRRRIEGESNLVAAKGVTLYSLTFDPGYIHPGEELEIRNPDDREGKRQPVEVILYVRSETPEEPDGNPP